MSFDYTNESFDEEDPENDYIVQDSIIFIVDGTQKMHKYGYFIECLETFKDIIRQKCSYNKNDKMGFIIFGTEDTNCEIDNVMILQEFSTVTIDMLKHIRSTLQNKANKYEQLASHSKGSIYDVLAYALQISQSYKNTKARNLIILCTCNDNPCSENTSEQSRIEHLVVTFKDSQIEFRVVGLSDFWDDELYYKDLQIISGTCSANNYKRISLKDFKHHILYPARSTAKLPWNFSEQISIQVLLMNLYSLSKYPKKIKLEKDDNEILEARQILRKEPSEYSQSSNSIELNSGENIVSPDAHIEYYKTYGGLRVSFNASEQKKIRILGLEPGIELLAFKPIMCDPMYHCKYAYFVTYDITSNKESKAFFIAFISKCSEKQVMPICRIVKKTSVSIAMMIPSEDDGGFYMCKIPFNDCVRNFDDQFKSYVFNSTNKCPINETAVDMFKDLIEFSKIDFDPFKFTNPMLEKCIAHIEALALDEVLDFSTADTTLPPPIRNHQADVLKSSLIKLLNLDKPKSFSSTSSSFNQFRSSSYNQCSKRTKYDIREMAQQGQLHRLTVAELREYLKSVGDSIQGNKTDLIGRVINVVSASIFDQS